MEGSPPENDRHSDWGSPPDSDLIGLPLFLGLGAAILAVAAAFIFIGGFAGLLALLAVLVLGLAVGYRVVTDSDPEN